MARRNDKKYKYQSRILNPLSPPFPRDKKRLQLKSFSGNELDTALEGIRRIRLISEILHYAYGTPTLGNQDDPVDEAIYIMITQKTDIKLAYDVFQELKRTILHWDAFLENPDEYDDVLFRGGRGNHRKKMILGFLQRVKDENENISLDYLRGKSPEEVFSELSTKYRLGKKTAYCVMVYSLGSPVFPVDSNVRRILKRIGFLDDFGIEVSANNHRKNQDVVAEIIPPDIAKELHINMVVHGRHTCKRKPNCHICPISKFCSYFRSKYKKKKSYSAVDLFAGPGGLSYGFTDAGWEIVFALEKDRVAALTHEFNHIGATTIREDITEIDGESFRKLARGKEIDIVMAGVPCQGFSLVGYRVRPDLKARPTQEDDSRNSLFLEVFRAVDIMRPKFVLFENVQGMSSSRVSYNGESSPVINALFSEFRNRGYKVTEMLLSAEKYGVPQTRRRLFVLGSRICDPNEIKDDIMRIASSKTKSLMEEIGDLPSIEQNDGLPITGCGEELTGDDLIWGPPKPRRILLGHISRPHNEFDMEIIRALDQGDTYKKVHDSYPEIIQRRKAAGYKVYKVSHFHDKFYRLKGNKPSRTIVSHLAKDGNGYIHPTQNRSLTPREAARLQGFPDDYIFFGSRSSQFVQIGNAVPPPLAFIIATTIQQYLEKLNEL